MYLIVRVITHQITISITLRDCTWIFYVLGPCTWYIWWLDCHRGPMNTSISILVIEDVCNGASCPGRFKHWWRSILGGDMAAVVAAVLKGDNFNWCPIFCGWSVFGWNGFLIVLFVRACPISTCFCIILYVICIFTVQLHSVAPCDDISYWILFSFSITMLQYYHWVFENVPSTHLKMAADTVAANNSDIYSDGTICYKKKYIGYQVTTSEGLSTVGL